MRLLLLALCLTRISGFSPVAAPSSRRAITPNTVPIMMARQRKTSESGAEAALLEEEETPAGVVGAEFFGGNKQKEELFDPVAEERAAVVSTGEYDRFQDAVAFDAVGRAVAGSLQRQLNGILYDESTTLVEMTQDEYTYSPNVQWESPFSTKGKSPLQQVQEALDFYRRVDISIISANQKSADNVELRWEISVAWPIFWEARVMVTGTSVLTLQDKTIVKQVDRLDQSDLIGNIASQVLPRFWDTYHIAMTPSAQVLPRIPVKKSPFAKYNLYEIMPRLVYKPSRLDTTGDREDAFAQVIPNHAFCTVIKTMGPKRQRYDTTSPVEVAISRKGGETRISWGIPISVELQTNPNLPLPGEDPETLPEAMPEVEYEFQSKRRVATLPYGGSPQDVEVTNVRKQLYEAVMKDGLKPKLDSEGRPQFFFFQNDAKACFTDQGLGMGVYDWRPLWAKANEVGIELELMEEGLSRS